MNASLPSCRSSGLIIIRTGSPGAARTSRNTPIPISMKTTMLTRIRLTTNAATAHLLTPGRRADGVARRHAALLA